MRNGVRSLRAGLRRIDDRYIRGYILLTIPPDKNTPFRSTVPHGSPRGSVPHFMSKEVIDSHLLKVLHTLLTESSVSRTAALLGQSQPTVSVALRKLRDMTGEPRALTYYQLWHDRTHRSVAAVWLRRLIASVAKDLAS
jgi:hypothetical protein